MVCVLVLELAPGLPLLRCVVVLSPLHTVLGCCACPGVEGTSVAAEALNERAVAVIRRVNAKLTGRDFGEVGGIP